MNKTIEKGALSEAEELMAAINRDLLALEQAAREGRENAPIINELFRRAHSFKSLSDAMGQAGLAEIAHEFENVLDGMRFGQIAAETQVLDTLFSCVDGFHHFLAFEGPEEKRMTKDIKDLLGALKNLIPKDSPAGEMPISIIDLGPDMLSMLTQYEEHRLRETLLRGKKIFILRMSFPLVDFDVGLASVEAIGEQLGEIICKLPSEDDEDMDKIGFDLVFAADFEVEELEQAFKGEDILLIPVNHDSIVWHDGALPESVDSDEDASVDAAASPFVLPASKAEKRDTQNHETEVAEAMPHSLKQLTHTVRVDLDQIDDFLSSTARAIDGVEQLMVRSGQEDAGQEGINDIKDVLVGLQEKLYRFRRLPLTDLFERMVRLGRKTARELGKQVRFDVRGAEVLVDADLVELLGEPILHLIRNAIDHGIESVEERLKQDKSPEACIEIAAIEEEGFLTVSVSDDGAGIDLEETMKVAQSKGLVPKQNPTELSENDILEWLLLPGFTTKTEASTVSGRGVGMDAVRSCIEEAGGALGLSSNPGQGVQVCLRFPLGQV
ncbi:MAG: ATP-binding protein [Myxococcota bacterium]|nr:ATP-binding protein [Myxococcota bacterium]